MKKNNLSRRDFLKNASLASGLLILPGSAFAQEKKPSANDKVNVACVGVGGMGEGDMNGVAATGANIVAVCDVDSRRLAKAKEKYPNAETFSDYRVMFDKMGKKIDAVTVSTPDHTHFTVSMTAMMMGKHVYVQKPMAHTVDQARRMTKAAADNKIVSQMGNQGHSQTHIRVAKEWYEASLLGDIAEVHSWSDRPIWPQGMDKFQPEAPVPEYLDWDLWLGPTKKRPYSPKVAPFDWRGYYEFGCGALGDMAVHIIDPAYYILDLGAPTKVEVEVLGKSPIAFPNSSKLTYHFPAKGKRGPVKVIWQDGRNSTPKAPEGVEKLDANGSLLIGSKATAIMGGWGNSFNIAGAGKFEELREKAPPVKYPRIRGSHYKNWIDAIRNNTQSSSDFSYAGPFTEMVLLGVIAQRVGKTLEWDAKSGKFTNNAEANTLLVAPPSREGFLA
ncbi:MAG: Gfo/Idh/MocA family oxidoreductase [Puniceicoccales bacterium]|jgi:predicted dehydrogenase|nr:Gfo/Idh/MocA family oxidoreductase [Puniceicoccales bacterium]